MIRIQAADATNGKQYTTERGQAVTVSGIEKSDAGVTVELRLPSGVTQKVPGHYPLLSAGISVDDLFSGPLESIRTAIPDLTPEQLEELVFLDQRPEVVAMVTTEQARRAGSAAPVATAPVATPAPSPSLLTPPPEPVQGRPVFTPIPVEGTPRYSVGALDAQTGEPIDQQALAAELNRQMNKHLDGADIDEARATPPEEAAKAFIQNLYPDATIVTGSNGDLVITTDLVPEDFPSPAPTRQEVATCLPGEGFTAEVVIPEKAEDRKRLMRSFTSPDQIDAAKSWPGYQAPTLDAEAKSWLKRYGEIQEAEAAGDIKALEALLELDALKIRSGLQQVARAAIARLSGAVDVVAPQVREEGDGLAVAPILTGDLPDLGGCSIEYDNDPGLPLQVPAQIDATCRLDLPSDVVLVGGPDDPATWITVVSDRPWPGDAEPALLDKLSDIETALGWETGLIPGGTTPDAEAATRAAILAGDLAADALAAEAGLPVAAVPSDDVITLAMGLDWRGAGVAWRVQTLGVRYLCWDLKDILEHIRVGTFSLDDLAAYGEEHVLRPTNWLPIGSTETLARRMLDEWAKLSAPPVPSVPTETAPPPPAPAPAPARPLYGIRFGADLVCPVCMARDVPPQLVAEGQVFMPLRLASHAYDGSRNGDECEGSGQVPLMIHAMRINQNREMVPVAGRTSDEWREALRKDYVELGFLAEDGSVVPEPEEPMKDEGGFWKEQAEGFGRVIDEIRDALDQHSIPAHRPPPGGASQACQPMNLSERVQVALDERKIPRKDREQLDTLEEFREWVCRRLGAPRDCSESELKIFLTARLTRSSSPDRTGSDATTDEEYDAAVVQNGLAALGRAIPALSRAGVDFSFKIGSRRPKD